MAMRAQFELSIGVWQHWFLIFAGECNAISRSRRASWRGTCARSPAGPRGCRGHGGLEAGRRQVAITAPPLAFGLVLQSVSGKGAVRVMLDLDPAAAPANAAPLLQKPDAAEQVRLNGGG